MGPTVGLWNNWNVKSPWLVNLFMNYRKLDAALAGAVDSATQAFLVSVRRERAPDLAEAQEFSRLGLSSPLLQSPTFTAHITREQVEALSEADWVKKISLSQTLQYK